MRTFFSVIMMLFAFVFNSLVGVGLSVAVGAPPILGALAANGMGVLSGMFGQAAGVMNVKLTKEIWLADIMEKFYPDWSFMTQVRDLSAFVDNDKINLAEAGVDPTVILNPTSFPIPFAKRTDTPHELVLDLYATEGTLLPKDEEVELNYDKRTSLTNGHKNALLNKFSKRAIYGYAPTLHSSTTPVIETTGAARADGTQKMTFADILTLKTQYDLLDAPADRVLVLHPEHYNELAAADMILFKQILTTAGAMLYGFKIYTYSQTPKYDASTLNKMAFETTDPGLRSSVSFISSEVMKAQGTFNMFERLDDPEYLGDIVNFSMRGLALPMRGKYMGAVIG